VIAVGVIPHALPRAHYSRPICQFPFDGSARVSPRRLLDDQLTEPDEMQRLTDDVARPDDDQLTQPAGENAVSGRYQSTDTAAIHERETREIDDDGGGRRLHQRIGQEVCGDDVELATERHEVDVELWELPDGNAEFWQHGEAISAEGCRWQIARRSVSSFMLPLFCIGRFSGWEVSPQITQQRRCTRGFSAHLEMAGS
jgi:hypothetical protein